MRYPMLLGCTIAYCMAAGLALAGFGSGLWAGAITFLILWLAFEAFGA